MQPLSIPKETFVREKKDIEMNILNTKQKWNFKVIKTNDEDKPLSDVEFELRKGTVDGEIIATKITPENGEIIFEDLTYDSYVLVEKSAPMAYKLLDPIAIGLDKFDKNTKEIIIPVKNEKQFWNLRVRKVDSETNDPLAGAVFVLKNAQGEIISEEKKTNYTGEIVFENLEYGKYTLTETQAPERYDLTNANTEVLPEIFDRKLKEITISVKNDKTKTS